MVASSHPALLETHTNFVGLFIFFENPGSVRICADETGFLFLFFLSLIPSFLHITKILKKKLIKTLVGSALNISESMFWHVFVLEKKKKKNQPEFQQSRLIQ